MRFRTLEFVATIALAACSGEPPHTNTVTGCVEQSIVGGSPGPTLVRLGEEQARSIVMVLVPSSASSKPPGVCSGVVVGKRAGLTAGHCFRGLEVGADGRVAGSATVVFGSAAERSARRVTTRAIWRHPELDVAVFDLTASAPAAASAIIPPHFVELDESWIGVPVELAGYGLTASGDLGTLGFAVETVAGLEPDHLAVDGAGKSGACAGDSGGPLLGSSEDGQISVLGVLDDGDVSCTGEDRYTRLDRLVGWEPLTRLIESTSTGCE